MVNRLLTCLLIFATCGLLMPAALAAIQDRSGSLTPLQLEIEKQRAQLSSAEGADRRSAITKLGEMRHPAASRAALPGLNDKLPIVRATAISAILSLPPEESSQSLLPLLSDKDEFVRREAAYALGRTRSATAVPLLISLLRTDKIDEVRGAAAVALGSSSSQEAVAALIGVLSGSTTEVSSKKSKKPKREQNPFVLRAAARSLGQMRSTAGVPILINVLQDEKSEDDVRREAAIALGMIGDSAALPALRAAGSARDPHLASAADAAIKSVMRRGTR